MIHEKLKSNSSYTTIALNVFHFLALLAANLLHHSEALAGLSLPFNIGGMLGGWVNFCRFLEGMRNESVLARKGTEPTGSDHAYFESYKRFELSEKV